MFAIVGQDKMAQGRVQEARNFARASLAVSIVGLIAGVTVIGLIIGL